MAASQHQQDPTNAATGGADRRETRTGTPPEQGAPSKPQTWSPAPGLVDGFPVVDRGTGHRADKPPDLFSLARAVARTPRERVPSSELVIDTIEDLVEAEYRCAVDDLRDLAKIEHRIAAMKAMLVERIDTAAARVAIVEEFEPWREEIFSAGTTAELAAALTMPESSATVLRGYSTDLVRTHPDTFAELFDGKISWQHATVIMDQLNSVETLDPATGEIVVPPSAIRALERELLALAPGVTVATFSKKARKCREEFNPASIEKRCRKARQGRRAVLKPDRDGMSWLGMYVPAETGQGIWNEATRTARSMQGKDESRTLSQLRVDVMADWLLSGNTSQPAPDTAGAAGVADTQERPVRPAPGAKDGHPSPKAMVLITVPVLTALGQSNQPAELEGYGPIPPSVARKLAAGASTFLRIMVDAFTGEFLAMDPHKYRVTGSARTLLRARDGTCTFTTCNTVTADTELDHLIAWENGGQSTPINLADDCKIHHLLKHFKDGKGRNGTRIRRKTNFNRTALPASGTEGTVGRSNQLPDRGATADGQPNSSQLVAGQPASDQRVSGHRVADGWTPTIPASEADRPGWISPAGVYYPPEPSGLRAPDIAPWILIDAIEEMMDRDTKDRP